jgi:hypothetical protein
MRPNPTDSIRASARRSATLPPGLTPSRCGWPLLQGQRACTSARHSGLEAPPHCSPDHGEPTGQAPHDNKCSKGVWELSPRMSGRGAVVGPNPRQQDDEDTHENGTQQLSQSTPWRDRHGCTRRKRSAAFHSHEAHCTHTASESGMTRIIDARETKNPETRFVPDKGPEIGMLSNQNRTSALDSTLTTAAQRAGVPTRIQSARRTLRPRRRSSGQGFPVPAAAGVGGRIVHRDPREMPAEQIQCEAAPPSGAPRPGGFRP